MLGRLTAVTLLLLLLPAGAAAQYSYQDPRWDPDYGSNSRWDPYNRGNSQELDRIARQLSSRANRLWNMVRDNQDFRYAQRMSIYNQIRDFARDARVYRDNRSDQLARQLVNRAENIRRLVDRTQLPNDFRNRWFSLEDQVAQMSRYYGINFSRRNARMARTDPYDDRDDRGGGYYGDRYGSGYFKWRGRVDGSDIVYLRSSQVDYRHLEAQPITNASVDLSAPLPRNPVNVQLRKLQGRGNVRIVERPSPSNNYAVGVLIEDERAGADWYEFELTW